MKNSPFLLLLLFVLPSMSNAQELEWERWGGGLGRGEVVRVGDAFYSYSTFKQSIGHNPIATITRHGIYPGDTSRTVRTNVMYPLRGIVPDGEGSFWGIQNLTGDIYHIDTLSGRADLRISDREYGSPYNNGMVGSNQGKLYYMDPNLVEVDLETGTYRTLSGYTPHRSTHSEVTVVPLGLSNLSDGGVAAVVHLRTTLVHEFSTDILDTLAIMFVRSDGSFMEPVVLPRDGLIVSDVISMNDMPNGDLLLSTITFEIVKEGNVQRRVPRVIHYRFTTRGELVAQYYWGGLDYLWGINDFAVAENGELIGVGTRNRGNHGTSSLMFRADLDGNILWSRSEIEFLYGVAQLDRIYRMKENRYLVSATTSYRHPDDNNYGSWLGLFNLDKESGIATDGEKTGASKLNLQ